MDELEDNLVFLPFLLEEDIYLIESKEIVDSKDEPVIAIKSYSQPSPLDLSKVTKLESIKPESPKVEVIEAEPVKSSQSQLLKTSVSPLGNKLIDKKVIIMVGYQGIPSVPSNVQEALNKIFEALKVDLSSVQIINVLASSAPKIEEFNFEYLILMGGNGKNLGFMQNFSGSRDRYQIVKHTGKTIMFAESMDVYFKDIELKKKFWNKLKEVFVK
jgi:hypothetical protein